MFQYLFLIVGSWGAYCSVFCCCNFYIEITFLCYYSADYLYFFEYLKIRLLLFSDLNVEVRPTVNIPLVCSVLYVVYWSELSSWRLVGHQPSMRVVLPFLMWTYCVVGSCTSGATSTSASELFVACSQFTGVGWSHSSMLCWILSCSALSYFEISRCPFFEYCGVSPGGGGGMGLATVECFAASLLHEEWTVTCSISSDIPRKGVHRVKDLFLPLVLRELFWLFVIWPFHAKLLLYVLQCLNFIRATWLL